MICKIQGCQEPLREDNILGICKYCGVFLVKILVSQEPSKPFKKPDPLKGAKNFQTEEELEEMIAEQRADLPAGWENMGAEDKIIREPKILHSGQVVINGRVR